MLLERFASGEGRHSHGWAAISARYGLLDVQSLHHGMLAGAPRRADEIIVHPPLASGTRHRDHLAGVLRPLPQISDLCRGREGPVDVFLEIEAPKNVRHVAIPRAFQGGPRPPSPLLNAC